MSSIFDKEVADVLRKEGGYSNDPNDSGGETNFGITIATARAFGYTKPMRDMTAEEAATIYRQKFWDALSLDQISQTTPNLSAFLFQAGVNVGVDVIGAFLQRSLNVLNMKGTFYPDIKVDGRVGPVTLASFREYVRRRPDNGVLVLTRAVNDLLGAYYIELAEQRQKDEEYVYGWLLQRTV